MPSIVVFLSITLPWLNPFSPGPTAAVIPWLFTLSSAMGLLQYFGATAVFGPCVNHTDMGN